MIITVITPVYNRADSIERCMGSVEESIKYLTMNRGGDFDDLEVEHIIVNDGSKDNTPQIVRQYAENHSWIRFISFSKNKGTNAARNAAISEAKGEWCVLLDSDDYFVPSALETIVKVMHQHEGYKHYMFAPDDMQPYYEQNQILKGCKEKALLYPDFLNGYIGGDFIHVCNTEILRRYPFDERLRIFEGVFFLMFFKEAQQMWFTNEVVTIRERNRSDSVSKDFLRINDNAIKKTILSNEIFLDHFESDLYKLGMLRRLHDKQLMLLDNYVLVGRYADAESLISKMGMSTSKKERLLNLMVKLKCGYIYKLLLKVYLHLKYEILKKKLRT